MSIEVAGMWKYPVTGAPGVPIEAAEFRGGGFREDRVFLVAEETPDGLVRLGSKEAPDLMKTSFDETGNVMYLDSEEIVLPYNNYRTNADPDTYCDEFGDPTPVWQSGAYLDRVFSEFLDRPVRFLQKTRNWQIGDKIPNEQRAVAPLHIIAMESVAAIAGASGAWKADVRRFRPNIALEGFDGPHDELELIGKTIVLGNTATRALIHIERGTPRCKVTSFDPETGENQSDISLRVMPKEKNRTGKQVASAGVYGYEIGNMGARLSIGDRFTIFYTDGVTRADMQQAHTRVAARLGDVASRGFDTVSTEELE